MPLFEIANAHPSFQYPLCSLRVKLPYGSEQSVPCAWKSLDNLKKVNFNVGGIELRRCRFLVKAVATTFEPKRFAAKEDESLGSKDLEMGLNPNSPEILLESSNEDSGELDEKEKLRRMRISQANKGKTPWNKGSLGRKHSAETLLKIKERTRLAMQNPKVKMKMVNASRGRALATETKQKIGTRVKISWEKKREKMVVQETCCLEWQNLIAEASRQGYVDQKELQWNSYETLDEQLKLEWLEGVKQRKQMPRAPGSKRAPKTPEQRRKIAEAITAKWADFEYRKRVCSAMAKYHGTEGAERKPRKWRSDNAQSTRRSPITEKDTDTNISVKRDTRVPNQICSRKSKSPAYKDHLVSSRLDMIKSTRAQRAAAETKLTKAIEQARLLIAEAEKAAKALEVTATKSPIAQASMIESRKLIAEATQLLESINTQGIAVSNVPSVALSMINEEKDAEFEVLNQPHMVPINGQKTLSSSDYKFSPDPGKFSLQKLDNGNSELHLTSTNGCASFPVGFNIKVEESGSSNQQMDTEQDQSSEYKTVPSPTVLGIQSIKDETQPKSPIVSKKWVRGRLVEEKQ